jgi:hypothetical protein
LNERLGAMAKVMVRHAEDDFRALQTAQGMEEAGATVFSIVNLGEKRQFNLAVFARFDEPITCNAVDEVIKRTMFPNET